MLSKELSAINADGDLSSDSSDSDEYANIDGIESIQEQEDNSDNVSKDSIISYYEERLDKVED